MGILIDGSVIVAAERGHLQVETLRDRFASEEVAIAAITASELLHGAHRADTTARRARRSAFVEAILEQVTIIPFDLTVARTHAAIWSDLARSGSMIGSHDLMIAATALTHEQAVATRNVREFARVEGLHVAAW